MKHDKGYKIKRSNDRIYRRNRSRSRSPWGIAGMVLLVAALFVLGWFVYPPVYRLLTQESEASQPSEPDVPESSASEEPEPVPEEEPTDPFPEELKMLYAPPSVVSSGTQLDDLLSRASRAGYNALLFDVKDDSGLVLYNTANEDAAECGAVSTAPVDLGALCEKVGSYQMEPVARLCTFKDHIVPNVRKEWAVQYMDQGILWLDNYAENGGKPWLNPYSKGAQDYNIQLAEECVERGVRMVVVDSVRFPNAVGVELATYGDDGGRTKADVLSDFVSRMSGSVTEAGGKLAVAAVGTVVVPGDTPVEYLGRPADYPCPLLINSMPALWVANDANLSLDQQYDIVLNALRVAQEATSQKLIPYVQAYTDPSVPEWKNRAYAPEDLQAQMDALKELGIGSYLLYNPEGSYTF